MISLSGMGFSRMFSMQLYIKLVLEPIRKPGICERLIGSEFWSQRADVLHRDRPQIPTAR